MSRRSDLPQIPPVPINGDPAMASFLTPVKEILEVYQGNKGNKFGLDKVVRFRDISALDPSAVSQSRNKDSRIVRITGDIIRTGKIESLDSKTFFDLDNQKLVFNAKKNYASQMPGIFIGKDDDKVFKFNLGHDSTGSLKFDGINTYLGLWSITENGIGDNLTENSSKIFLDHTNTRIRVGPSHEYLNIDGDSVLVESSNYVSGVMGTGFTLRSELLEVGNIACRGIFRTAVFQKDVVSAIGGNLLVRPADVLDAVMSATETSGLLLEDGEGFLLEGELGQALAESGDNLTIEGNETFAVDDILRIKDGISDEWMIVTSADNAPSYTVTRDAAGSYGEGELPEWQKGATVVNYGTAGDGGIYMTASETYAPYLSIFTHAGSPWAEEGITTHLRIGNLNGFIGYSSDLYGIAIGSTTKYLKYDSTNHLRIQGNITVTGDNGYLKIYDSTPTERVRVGNLDGFLGYPPTPGTSKYGIAIGDTNRYLKYDQEDGLALQGNMTITGTYGYIKIYDATPTETIRLGNLNGYPGLDYESNIYGIVIGDEDAYLSYEATNGLRVHGLSSLDSLSAINADLGTITAGNITFDTSGFLRSNGKDDYSDTTSGFFIGYDTDDYKVNIGDGDNHIKWTGTAIDVKGSLGANEIITNTANIKNAIITGAKIGNAQVDTLQLAGQAVTIPVSAHTAGSQTINDGSTDSVQSAAITSTGAPVLIIASLDSDDTAGGTMIIKRGSTTLATVSLVNGATTYSIQDTPGAGSVTYYIYVGASGDNVNVTERSLLLLETKK